MPKIQEMIDQTQKQVQEKLQHAQQLEQGIQQAQQSLQQTISEYHTLVARLNTLQEVAGAGADLFAVGIAAEPEQAKLGEAGPETIVPLDGEKGDAGTMRK